MRYVPDVDLKSLSKAGEIGEKLLLQLNTGLGFIPTIGGQKEDEEAAIKYLIDEIKTNENLDNLTKAAFISRARKILKEYVNQNRIVDEAIRILTDPNKTDKSSELDDEWLSYFMDAAKNVSKEDMQTLWGKILAKECQSPGVIPKSFILTLATLDIESAMAFEVLRAYVVLTFGKLKPIPMIDLSLISKYSESINYEILIELEERGLIKISGIGDFEISTTSISIFLPSNQNRMYNLIAKTGNIHVGNVIFTKIGEKLYEVLETPNNNRFEEYIKEFAQKRELQLNPVKIKFCNGAPNHEHEE